jgi:hypothetical protein
VVTEQKKADSEPSDDEAAEDENGGGLGACIGSRASASKPETLSGAGHNRTAFYETFKFQLQFYMNKLDRAGEVICSDKRRCEKLISSL